MRFRIYIDESGNSDLKASTFDNNRFLSLTGIIIKEPYARTYFREAVEKLKEKRQKKKLKDLGLLSLIFPLQQLGPKKEYSCG